MIMVSELVGYLSVTLQFRLILLRCLILDEFTSSQLREVHDYETSVFLFPQSLDRKLYDYI